MHPSIDAVFFDIDGTFYDHRTNSVLKSSLQAVQALQTRGIKTALCSGRPLRMAKELPDLFQIQWDGFIGSAGNVVYDSHFHKIAQQGFTFEELQKIFSIARQKGITLYVNGDSVFLTKNDPEAIAILRSFHVQIPTDIRDLQEDDSVEMISMFKGYDYDYSDFMSIPGLILQKSSGKITDIMKKGVDKYKGIQKLMEHWNLVDGHYLAFGDSMNDKSMLEHAAIGVAMENSDEELKAFAHSICGPSHTPAIWDTLKKLHLIWELF